MFFVTPPRRLKKKLLREMLQDIVQQLRSKNEKKLDPKGHSARQASHLVNIFVGRGSRQRNLRKSTFCNDYKVLAHRRERAIELFDPQLKTDTSLRKMLWSLSVCRPPCHCQASQAWSLTSSSSSCVALHPRAYDRDSLVGPPTSDVPNCMTKLREEPESEGCPSADEGVPGAELPMAWHWRATARRQRFTRSASSAMGNCGPLHGRGRLRADGTPTMTRGRRWPHNSGTSRRRTAPQSVS